MASEKTFVRTLMKAMGSHDTACVWKPSDGFTLGIPDINAVIDGVFWGLEVKVAKRIVASIDEVHRLGDDVLRHKFSGPQISMLRKLERAGAQAWGIIQVTKNHAYQISPWDIRRDGNISATSLLGSGFLVSRTRGWVLQC